MTEKHRLFDRINLSILSILVSTGFFAPRTETEYRGRRRSPGEGKGAHRANCASASRAGTGGAKRHSELSAGLCCRLWSRGTTN